MFVAISWRAVYKRRRTRAFWFDRRLRTFPIYAAISLPSVGGRDNVRAGVFAWYSPPPPLLPGSVLRLRMRLALTRSSRRSARARSAMARFATFLFYRRAGMKKATTAIRPPAAPCRRAAPRILLPRLSWRADIPATPAQHFCMTLTSHTTHIAQHYNMKQRMPLALLLT